MTSHPPVRQPSPWGASAQRRSWRVWWCLVCAVTVGLPPILAQGQSFDCGKARDGVERAICASPRLRQLDTEVAGSYASALRRDPTQTDAVRQAQRSWSKLRLGCLTAAKPPAPATIDPTQCLITAYTNRLAALAPTATPATATPAAPAAAITAQQPPPAAKPADQSAPAQASPPFAEIRLATGVPPTPPGSATMERGRFPTAGETDVLLHVTAPGRFAIRAESPTGTALQLVDMLSGPGEQAGWAGKQDGRIDALLDVGTYKVRAFGDPAATGDTALSVTAFLPTAANQIAPSYQPVAMTLADLQFQAFWLVVGDSAAPTRIEAAGRSLAALKLWRDGRDLVAIPETTRILASNPAHPLTDILLSDHLASGTYLITAYGGPPLPWSDGSTDQPLYLRTGRSTDLLAGGATGQVGPVRHRGVRSPAGCRRRVAGAAAAGRSPSAHHRIGPVRGPDHRRSGQAKLDRSSTVLANFSGGPARERSLSLDAAPGQAFILRPLRAAGGSPPRRPGRYWFGVAAPLNGGDEAPAAAILSRIRYDAAGRPTGPPEVLATPGVPSVGPGKAWRARFNFRGETALLFQATDAVTVAVHADGPPVTPLITTVEGAVLNAMGDGRTATSWTLSPGWAYTLVLKAPRDAIGILDLTLGPPGLIPSDPDQPGPPAPILPLGERVVDANSRLDLVTNRVPGGTGNLLTRTIPVELADGALVQTLPAGAAQAFSVHARQAGTLVVRDVSGGAPLETTAIAADATTPITLPAADHARTLAIAVLPPASAAPNPAPVPTLTALRDGQPVFFDLDRGAQASFALTVGQGGLYRVETTGRLKTAGSIGTSFIPVLGEANANGVGNNMLLQRFLRGGRYRLDVTARESAGRLGVTANATPLAEGATLLPGLSVRATLSPGHGVAFPIHIAAAGRYHLDILGDGRSFLARLEDAGGWPMLAAGEVSSVEQDFPAGDYRLIVQPPGVQARVVARLRRIEPPVLLEGHGPHALPFDAPQSLEWREPLGRDDPRAPDLWTFALAGPAKATLSITGDGMTAVLQSAAADAGEPPLGRLLAGTPLTVTLPAGAYRVTASSLGRNDRLTYKISLHTDELQPDTPRDVTMPVELPIAVAAPRVVTLTSFGMVPVRAELHDDSGHVLASANGRTDDWNIALSRFLPVGRYSVMLAPLAPPPGGSASSDAHDSASNDDSSSSGSNSDADNQPDSANSAMDQSNGDQSDQADQSDQSDQTTKRPAHTEVTLFLPPDSPDVKLADSGFMSLPGHGVQHVTLPAPPNGSLLVAAAEAPVELILALERQGSDDTWHTVGQDQGLAPVLGIPVGDATAAWRISVWTVDGGTVPIRLAARAVTATPTPIGTVPLAPIALDGITRHWNAALVADPGALMLRLTEPTPALRATSARGQPAAAVADATIVAQSDLVWLMAPWTRSRSGWPWCNPSRTRNWQSAYPPPGEPAYRSPGPHPAPMSPPPVWASLGWMPGVAWVSRKGAPSRFAAVRCCMRGMPAVTPPCGCVCAVMNWRCSRKWRWIMLSRRWCRRMPRCRCGWPTGTGGSTSVWRRTARWWPAGGNLTHSPSGLATPRSAEA